MPRPKQSFGEQAARFSLYAPFAVLLIGLLTLGNRDQWGVGITIGVINILLLVAGLGLGIVALLSMRRFGRERILGRAIVGILLNGLAVGFIASALFPLLQNAGVRR